MTPFPASATYPQPAYQGPGLYTHFKGGRYCVIGTARHTETGETLVLYHDSETPEETAWEQNSVHARPLWHFNSLADRDGETIPRWRKETSVRMILPGISGAPDLP